MVKQFVDYITLESVCQGMPFLWGWLGKAMDTSKRGNKLVVYEIGQDNLPFDVRGTDFDCGYVDGIYSLGNTSAFIMPPDGIGNG